MMTARVRFPLLVTAVVTALVFATTAEATPAHHGATTAAGATANVAADGTFTVDFGTPRLHFAGSVGHPVRDLTRHDGADATGRYTEVDFRYGAPDARRATIRAYRATPVVEFGLTYVDGGANTEPFPALSTHPALPYQQSYSGCFAGSQFGATAGPSDSPWLFFDHDTNGFLLSPASHFPVARTWTSSGGAISTGIDPAITTLPAGTTQRTLLVATHGINAGYQRWGHALTNLEGKTRPANDADVTLDKLGYWTDNITTYYYRYDPSLGYAGTLRAVQADWAAKGIPLAYLQLDSWFYPKGPQAQWNDNPDGQYLYQAAPDLFPDGLSGFQASTGVPLVTHARWLDPASPYRSQYAVSGNVVTDPAYWNDRMGYLASSGVTTYEQDWLCSNAQPAYNLTDRDAFLDNMASAAAAHGLTMQYCMPLPRDVLQESKYSNLTTSRVSDDGFDRGKWDAELYTSQLVSAVGTWPWVDAFPSTDLRSLLLADLSAGPVGVGDAIGAESKPNLMQVARPDGVLVKPDAALTPTDATYVAQAAGEDPAMVAATHADHGNLRDSYVYAYARSIPLPTPDATYQAEDATLAGPTVSTDNGGYTGSGYADYQHASGDYTQWTVQAPADGTYTLMFRYANGGSTDRPLDVAVNGTSAGTEPFAPSGGWTDWTDQTAVVTLHAGANTVRATATGASGANLDYLGVSAGTVTVPTTQPASFTPSQLGTDGPAYVYDYFTGTGTVVPAGHAFTTTVDKQGSYYQVAPVDRAGIALLGDAGKFVSAGAKRITALRDDGHGVRATAAFAPGEQAITVHGYSRRPVRVSAPAGTVTGVAWDPGTHLFSFQLHPTGASSASFLVQPA